MTDKAKIVIVAALSKTTRAIGKNNELLWHIPEDMRRFKQLTAHHPVIMGRKTFESIVAIIGKPLPGRPNIVVSRNKDYAYEGVTVAPSLDEALRIAQELDHDEIHIGGGAELYAQAMPIVDTLYLTLIDDEPEADTFFPAFEETFVIATTHEKKEHNGLYYQWVDYERKRS